MSEGENLGVSKERAKADAMRNATEKAGVYVKNYTRTKNLTLEEDIIETMTANILKLVEDPKFLPYEQLDNLEGLLIRVIVKVQIDDSDIMRWLNKDEQEKSELVSQMEALRKSYDEQARQIAELKRQLANNPQDTEQITKKFADEDKIFLATQKFDEARKFHEHGDYKNAIELYNEAIELNPNYAKAYSNRGWAYSDLKHYERAVQDCSKAIELDSNYNWAWNNRGVALNELKQYERAIQDFNKAIELNPNYAKPYNNRGLAYNNLKEYERAIQDFDKAILLNPNYAQAYNNRGICYQQLGEYEKAQADFAKAKELGYKD